MRSVYFAQTDPEKMTSEKQVKRNLNPRTPQGQFLDAVTDADHS